MTKLKSRKLWITIWAIAMLTYALFAKVDLAWFNGLAPILGGIVAVYVGVQGLIDHKGSNRNE
jgi:hypothetical protein